MQSVKQVFLTAAILFLIIAAGCGENGMETGALNQGTEGADLETGTTAQKDEKEYPPIGIMDLIQGENMDNPAGMLQDASHNVMVRIQAGDLIGSGVIYQSDERTVWIATAGHVLDHVAEAAVITFVDGYVAETKRFYRAENKDLAILEIARTDLVEDGTDHGAEYRSAVFSQETYDNAASGDLVIAMGSKSGVGEDAYAGVLTQDYVWLEDFEGYMMLADVMVKPGMSGGGLFDAQGNLLGILCGVAEDGEVAVVPIISLMAMER